MGAVIAVKSDNSSYLCLCVDKREVWLDDCSQLRGNGPRKVRRQSCNTHCKHPHIPVSMRKEEMVTWRIEERHIGSRQHRGQLK